MARIFKVFHTLSGLRSLDEYMGLGDLGNVPPAMQVAVFKIPGGEAGTRKTLERMRKIAIDSLKDKQHGAFLRGLAIKITLDAGCKTKEFRCEAKALFDWVRDNVKWIRDTRGFETLQYPYRTLAFGAGDCDDLCLSGPTTYVWVKINGRLCRMTLKELYKYFVPVGSRKLVMAGTHTVDHVDDEEFLRPIENLKIEVLSTRGKGQMGAELCWRPVTRMYHKTAPVDLLKITISGGRSITCTPNHRLYRSDGEYFTPVRAGELSVGDTVVCVHEVPEYSEFPSMLSDEDLFMLGFWTVAGCYEHKLGPKFACGKDETLARRVQAWAATRKGNWDKPVGSSVSSEGDVTVYSSALMSWMKELGFEGTPAAKRVPGWVFELPNDQLGRFVAGYFEGGGSIRLDKTKEKTEVVICSVNRGLLYDVLEILSRFGIEGVIDELDPEDSNGASCGAYRLVICSRPMVEKFIERIGNFRDKESVLPGSSGAACSVSSRAIRSIEKVREYEIFDLEVEADCRFIVDPDHEHVFVANGLLTHNSILLAALATSIGIPTKFRAIAANPLRRDQFSHVYVLMDPFGDGKWIAADPTVKSASFGWESPVRYRVMDLEV